MKHLKYLVSTGVVFGLASLPTIALAQGNPFDNAGKLVGEVGNGAGLGTPKPLSAIIGSIINIALGFLGIVLLFYLLYGGFTWMTAGGDSKKVDEAKAMIRNAIVGLIVIIAAFAISSFVLTSLVNATKG